MKEEINPYIVIKVIQDINENFTNIYLQNNIKLLKECNVDYQNIELPKRDPYLYYLNGHCNSYSDILCAIFKNNAIKYNSDSHVITKIGKHFYDVSGLIDDLVDDKFHESEIQDLYYIDISLCRKDEIEKPVEKDLINIGLETLHSLNIENINEKKAKI